MSPTKNTFGPRVVGQKEYDRALREEQGGGSVFGVRVRGEIPDDGPTNRAKRNTEHGPRVVDEVEAADHRGSTKDGGAMSIDDLRNALAENPTFFDSLYEFELARNDGARPDALRIFQEIERGIKGQGRADVLDEIAQLLGQKRELATARANLDQAHREQLRRMYQRQQENALLVDADKIQALAERAENLDAIKESDSAGSKEQLVSPNVESQIAQIGEEKGLDLRTGPGEPGGSTPAKPGGPINVESSQPGKHPLVPKAGQEGEVGTEDEGGEGQAEQDYEAMSRDELEEEAEKLKVDFAEIKGSGSGGRVLKEDLLKAVKKAAKKQEK